jgi:hypothetical protein
VLSRKADPHSCDHAGFAGSHGSQLGRRAGHGMCHRSERFLLYQLVSDRLMNRFPELQ